MFKLKKIQVILYKIEKNETRFLLLKRSGNPEIWQGITGGVETKDKTLLDAAIREIKEELNHTVEIAHIKGPLYEFEFVTNRKGYEGKVAKEYCFSYRLPLEYEVELSNEHTDFAWLPFDKAIERIDFETSKKLLKMVYEDNE